MLTLPHKAHCACISGFRFTTCGSVPRLLLSRVCICGVSFASLLGARLSISRLRQANTQGKGAEKARPGGGGADGMKGELPREESALRTYLPLSANVNLLPFSLPQHAWRAGIRCYAFSARPPSTPVPRRLCWWSTPIPSTQRWGMFCVFSGDYTTAYEYMCCRNNIFY